MREDSNKLISIIVPVYNVEKYLRRCVDSIINQTCGNIEILLIDDGSTDSSGEIADWYADNYRGTVKTYHKKNGGLSDARNYGIERASAGIIGFVDSDDWIRADMYSRMLELMESTGADIVCCSYAAAYEKGADNSVKSGKTEKWSKEYALEKLCENKIINSHAWDKIYRKKLFENIRFPEGKLYEDIYIMHRIFAAADSIYFIDEAFYYYFFRSDSIVNTVKWKNISDFYDSEKSRYNDIITMTDSKIIRDAARTEMLRALIKCIRLSYNNKNNDGIRPHIKELKAELKKFPIKDVRLLGGRREKIRFLYLKSPLPFRPEVKEKLKKTAIYAILRGLREKLRISVCKYRYLKKEHANLSSLFSEASGGGRIILLGVPEYNNIGDIAIAVASEEYIRENFPDNIFCGVTEDDIRYNLRRIKKHINKADLLLLQGGGNLNEFYEDQNIIRETVLKTFPDNRIILMPQSFSPPSSDEGIIRLGKIKSVFEGHKNFTLFARDPISYAAMKDFFNLPAELSPDIVLSIPFDAPKDRRDGIGICLRNDIESGLTVEQRNQIIYTAVKYSDKIKFIDTLSARDIPMEEHKAALMNKLNEISSCGLIITDRLHGLIFSAIASVPCIAVNTANSKIEGISVWFSGKSCIRRVSGADNIGEIIKSLMAEDTVCAPPDTYRHFERLYETIRENRG